MFLTQPVIDLPDCFVGIPVIVEFVGAVQSGTVKLEIINGSVSAHVNSPEVGKVNEDIDVQDVSGSDLVISFNPTYLIDALKALKSETVRVRFISPVRPFTLTPADDSENFIQLITPVRTN